MPGGLPRPLSHDPPCPHCGCAFHHFLPCECGCDRLDRPGDEES